MTSVISPGADASIPFQDFVLGEPTLDEILSDPIVGLILRRDGLTAAVVRGRLDRERRRLSRPPALPCAA